MNPSALFPYSARKEFPGERLCVLGVFLAVTIWNLPTLWFPYGQDQALAHLMGRLILDGGVVYRDALDDKPPLVFYLYGLVQRVAGDGMMGVRALDLLALWITMALLCKTGTALQSPGAGRWGALLFGMVHPLLGFWNTALQESLLLPLLWWTLLGGIRAWREGGKGPWFRCGIALGLVFWFKYPYALPLGILLIASAMGGPGGLSQGGRSTLGAAGALLGGFLAVVAAGGMYLWHLGALEELVRITVLKNAAERLQPSFRLSLPASPLGPWNWLMGIPLPAVMVVLGGLGAVVLLARRTAGSWLVAAYALSMMGLIYLQMRFFHYHWIPVLSFLCFLSGLLLAAGHGWIQRLRPFSGPVARGLSIGLAAILFFGLGAVSQETNFRRWWLGLRGQISWEAYLATFPGTGRSAPFVLEDWAVSRFLLEMDPPAEEFFLWGSRPLVYYFTGSLPASRFLYIHHLFMAGHRAEPFRKEVEEDLVAHRPRVVLVFIRDTWADTLSNMARLVPRAHELLATQYMLVEKIGPFLAYERFGPEGGLPAHGN